MSAAAVAGGSFAPAPSSARAGSVTGRKGRIALALAVAVAALTFLVGAAPANAGPWKDHALKVARQTFGVPDCGMPRIVRADPNTYAGEGQAAWLRPATAWADPERCVIARNRTQRVRTKWRYCHVIVHEWGHLAGYGHSDNPLDLMWWGEAGMEGKVKRPGRRAQWIAQDFFGPCEPRTVKRSGKGKRRRVTGSMTI